MGSYPPPNNFVAEFWTNSENCRITVLTITHKSGHEHIQTLQPEWQHCGQRTSKNRKKKGKRVDKEGQKNKTATGWEAVLSSVFQFLLRFKQIPPPITESLHCYSLGSRIFCPIYKMTTSIHWIKRFVPGHFFHSELESTFCWLRGQVGNFI